jgi:hypothetical protein
VFAHLGVETLRERGHPVSELRVVQCAGNRRVVRVGSTQDDVVSQGSCEEMRVLIE